MMAVWSRMLSLSGLLIFCSTQPAGGHESDMVVNAHRSFRTTSGGGETISDHIEDLVCLTVQSRAAPFGRHDEPGAQTFVRHQLVPRSLKPKLVFLNLRTDSRALPGRCQGGVVQFPAELSSAVCSPWKVLAGHAIDLLFQPRGLQRDSPGYLSYA